MAPYALISFSVVTSVFSDPKELADQKTAILAAFNYGSAIVALLQAVVFSTPLATALGLYAGGNLVGALVNGLTMRFPSMEEPRTARSLIEDELDKLVAPDRGPGFGLVNSQSKLYLRDNPDEVESSLRDGRSPKHIALLLSSNVAQDDLISGRHHVYRGVLDLTGEDALRVFNLSLDGLVEIGQMEPQERQSDIEKLTQEIKRVG